MADTYSSKADNRAFPLSAYKTSNSLKEKQELFSNLSLHLCSNLLHSKLPPKQLHLLPYKEAFQTLEGNHCLILCQISDLKSNIQLDWLEPFIHQEQATKQAEKGRQQKDYFSSTKRFKGLVTS